MRILVLLALLAGCLLVAGCCFFDDTRAQQPTGDNIPWNTPAGWEGGTIIGR